MICLLFRGSTRISGKRSIPSSAIFRQIIGEPASHGDGRCDVGVGLVILKLEIVGLVIE
jgi:hypothetical protein